MANDLPSRRPDKETDEPIRTGLNRRQLMKASAWASPVIVLTTAVPALAAASLAGSFWALAVRTTSTDPAANLSPGFRFGHAGTTATGNATVTFTSSTLQTGLPFGEVFTAFNSVGWTWIDHADGTYTATASFPVGPSTIDGGSSGGTVGLTIKYKTGTYSAQIGSSRASFTHPV